MAKVTPKVTLLAHTPHPEQVVATAAKLCYSPADIEEIARGVEEKDVGRFIGRLTQMNHLSPVEHAGFTFGIEGVSRSLLAQITRHRIASFSVKSQRYVAEKSGFNYVVPPAVEALGEDAVREFEGQMATVYGWYLDWQRRLGGEGESSNEDARFVLPNAAETKLIVSMNARELTHFFSLRCCNRAQWEIRAVAWRMLELALEVAPNLFEGAGPACVRGACGEGRMSCGRMDEVRARRQGLAAKDGA